MKELNLELLNKTAVVVANCKLQVQTEERWGLQLLQKHLTACTILLKKSYMALPPCGPWGFPALKSAECDALMILWEGNLQLC